MLKSTRSKLSGIPNTKNLPIKERSQPSCEVENHPALSNYVILKEIFGNLSCPDLITCCNVSPIWMNIAGPMINNYIFTLTVLLQNEELLLKDMVGFPTIYSSRNVSKEELEGILISARVRLPITMEFHLDNNSSIETSQKVLKFLSEFGKNIHVLRLSTGLKVKTFLKYLSYCPNLQVLDCAWFDNKPDKLESDFVIPNLFEIRINESMSKWTMKCVFDAIFRIASNVKRLRVPFEMLGTVSECEKVGAVKTLMGYGNFDMSWKRNEIMKEVYTRLRHASEHGVILTSIAAPNFHKRVRVSKLRPRKVIARKIKFEFYHILKASKDTLQVQTNPLAKFDYYYPTPFQMASVKLLIFEGLDWCSRKNAGENKYFRAGTILEQIFPNLEALGTGNSTNKGFPKDTFDTQFLKRVVKKLKIGSSCGVKTLVRFYTNVTHLVLSDYCVESLKDNFPTICKGLPMLTIFKIFLTIIKTLTLKHLTLDSSFTGLPDDICNAILDIGCSLESILSDDEITEQQSNNPSLFLLKQLKNLDIIVEDSGLTRQNICRAFCLRFITEVTAEAALKHLPLLTVSVWTRRERQDIYAEVRKTLAPIWEFIRLDNNYADPEYYAILFEQTVCPIRMSL